jgi:NAD(P)-dependent dehydrogenase (short-subunit alcohol dehydrogenase family)
VGNPDETAAVALFLASDDSSFMTGSEVFFDGGWRRSDLADGKIDIRTFRMLA